MLQVCALVLTCDIQVLAVTVANMPIVRVGGELPPLKVCVRALDFDDLLRVFLELTLPDYEQWPEQAVAEEKVLKQLRRRSSNVIGMRALPRIREPDSEQEAIFFASDITFQGLHLLLYEENPNKGDGRQSTRDLFLISMRGLRCGFSMRESASVMTASLRSINVEDLAQPHGIDFRRIFSSTSIGESEDLVSLKYIVRLSALSRFRPARTCDFPPLGIVIASAGVVSAGGALRGRGQSAAGLVWLSCVYDERRQPHQPPASRRRVRHRILHADGREGSSDRSNRSSLCVCVCVILTIFCLASWSDAACFSREDEVGDRGQHRHSAAGGRSGRH